jgi:putative ABC transport system permease protein
MIKNYFKIAFRHLSKSVRFTFINVVGMSLGMACTLLIFLIVRHETSYDQNNAKGNRIYRVENQNVKENQTYAGNYTGMTNALHTDVPEAEKVVSLLQFDGSIFSTLNSDNRFKESFVFANNELFNLLDYSWIAGDAHKALSQPNTVVLSRHYAEKYFGKTDVIGEIIQLDNKHNLMVTGVLENYPSTSSFPFDILVSFQSLKTIDPTYDLNKWNGWNDNYQIFILLKEGIKPEQLTQRFSAIVRKYISNDPLYVDKRFVLNPLSEIHYSSNLSGRMANTKLLRILSLIGILVLLISCFNFINLSTAQAFKRAKEVGVRKVIGSSRLSVIYQFLTEAGLITGMAALIAILITHISLPYITSILDISVKISDLLTWQNSLFVVGLLFLTTLLAGLYPALRLSGMAPILALNKDNLKKGNQGFSLRQSLVVIQFTISLILISCAFLINQQLSFFQKTDLGFNKNAIITVALPDNKGAKLQTLRNQLMAYPQIKDVSFSFNSASSESNWMQMTHTRMGENPVDIKTQLKMVDAHYLTTYGIKLLAGQFFKEGDTLPKVVANEVYLSRMGITRAEDAIGQKLYYGDSLKSVDIIGVVKDFNVNSLHQKIDPTLLRVVPQHFYQAGIKLVSNDLRTENLHSTIAHIQKAWTASFPNQVFEYKFLDDELGQAYKSEIRTGQLIETATFIAILIACLGLFGLATFTAEQRTKEIGVRKVLGASVSSILVLLSKDFLKLILIAILIATPIAWWAMHQWLQNFEFKIHISWWTFGFTGLLMVCIALLTVSFQSLKAAVANPVKSLRTE